MHCVVCFYLSILVQVVCTRRLRDAPFRLGMGPLSHCEEGEREILCTIYTQQQVSN